jgi:uncharacterized protein (TIGR00375 family)
MHRYYADLHIHIGSAQGRAVKITASRHLTLHKVLFQDAPRKGLDIVGIVDTGSPLVSAEMEAMLTEGSLQELAGGGFLANNGVLLVAGCEIETCEGIHVIIYLPDLKSIRTLQKYLHTRVKNPNLSTQAARCSTLDLINLNVLLDGIFCPAHVFTPHKGIYGCWTRRWADVLGRQSRQIKVLELGLSADTDMADCIAETRPVSFLSNSDAHSSGNIGREFNLLRMQNKNFEELRLCLYKSSGRNVAANFGMDPLLGKYHRTYCNKCRRIAVEEAPILKCPVCGGTDVVMGVYDRIVSIRDYDEPHHPVGRPLYRYRVPLKDLPGVGPRTLQSLWQAFSSEIDILENAPMERIAKVGGARLAALILGMRKGRLNIQAGGGGYYGKVLKGDGEH